MDIIVTTQFQTPPKNRPSPVLKKKLCKRRKSEEPNMKITHGSSGVSSRSKVRRNESSHVNKANTERKISIPGLRKKNRFFSFLPYFLPKSAAASPRFRCFESHQNEIE